MQLLRKRWRLRRKRLLHINEGMHAARAGMHSQVATHDLELPSLVLDLTPMNAMFLNAQTAATTSIRLVSHWFTSLGFIRTSGRAMAIALCTTSCSNTDSAPTPIDGSTADAADRNWCAEGFGCGTPPPNTTANNASVQCDACTVDGGVVKNTSLGCCCAIASDPIPSDWYEGAFDCSAL